jgi:hypothetical protein
LVPSEDGDNATGGGPVELITDVDFSVDRFDTPGAINFATNIGAGTGGAGPCGRVRDFAGPFKWTGRMPRRDYRARRRSFGPYTPERRMKKPRSCRSRPGAFSVTALWR